MAMATSVLCPQNITGAIVSNTKKRMNNKVAYIRGVNSFSGLKANNDVITLGKPLSTEKCFAKIVKATASNGRGRKGGGGGALSSTCNAASEIFTIAAIINGLVLVGVAVGFVLLRIEAWVEESETE